MRERRHTENRRRRHRRKPKRRGVSGSNSGKDTLLETGSSVVESPPQGEDVQVLIYTYTRYKRAR